MFRCDCYSPAFVVFAVVIASAEACGSPGGDASGAAVEKCDASSSTIASDPGGALIQLTRGTKRSTEELAELTPQRNISLFYDGSGNEMHKKCWWPAGADCETNIAKLYHFASAVPDAVTYYEPGVGADEEDSYQFGVGVMNHAMNGYRWLCQNYQPGDNLFVFAFSRGTLSARVLQGILHRTGLAKPEHCDAAVEAFRRTNDADAKLSDDMVWPQATIHFMGLFDAPLGTMWHPIKHSDVASFHMTFTPKVKHLYHAISLSEFREHFQSNELVADSSTVVEQVWFTGVHSDVGGGYPHHEIANIAGGYMADRAIALGLPLKSGWDLEMPIDFLGDLTVERHVASHSDAVTDLFEMWRIRDPSLCRSERPGGATRIKVHQSVIDRMASNKGWVPLPYCCAGREAAMNSFGIDHVTNPHYKANKQKYEKPPASWIKVHLGELRNVDCPELTSPEYYVRVQNWHHSASLETGIQADGGCCHVLPTGPHHKRPPEVHGWWWHKKASQDFSDTTVVLPYEPGVADQIVIDVMEKDWPDADDFVGRLVLPLEPTVMSVLDLGNGASLGVGVEYVLHDKDIATDLGGSPAQCAWLRKTSQHDMTALCSPSTNQLMQGAGFGAKELCHEFFKRVGSGE